LHIYSYNLREKVRTSNTKNWVLFVILVKMRVLKSLHRTFLYRIYNLRKCYLYKYYDFSKFLKQKLHPKQGKMKPTDLVAA